MTPILQTLIPLLKEHAANLASAFIEGREGIGGKHDDEIASFLEDRDVEWHDLATDLQDKLRDEWLEAFQTECARRLALPVTIPITKKGDMIEPGEVLQSLSFVEKYTAGLAPGPHRDTMTKGLNLLIYGVESPGVVSLPVSAAQAALVERMQDLWKKCRNVGSGNSVCHEVNVLFPQIMPLVLKALSEPSPASSPVPAPLVPDAVKAALEALEGLLKHVERQTCSHEETYRGGSIWTICSSCGMKWADDEGGMPKSFPTPKAVEKAESALSALRLLTAQEGSVCEVEPLEEVAKFLEQADRLIDRCVHLLDEGAPQMAKDAANDAGCAISDADRALAKFMSLPSSPPSSEDTELLDWLEDDPEYWSLSRTWKDGRIIRLETGTTRYFEAVREAVRAAKASTTTQKGGQGV